MLFDIDGTLLDTREMILRSFEYTLVTHDITNKSREELRVLIGKSLEEIYLEIAPDYDPFLLSDTHRSYQEKNLNLYTVFPSTHDALQQLKNSAMKIAAVTTRKQTALLSLDHTDTTRFFDAIITGDTTTHVKPNPESLINALNQINIEPSEAIMVGDTEADILAGKNAGTKTIGVTYGFRTRDELSPYAPDYLIDDLKDLPDIIAKLNL